MKFLLEETQDELLTSQKLRDELKKAGYAPRDISVIKEPGGYSLSFRVTIKNPTIDIKDVEKIVKKYEYYETDDASGEILSGGNTFIFVEYAYDVFKDVIKPYLQKAEEIINKIDEDDRHTYRVDNNLIVSKDGYNYRVDYLGNHNFVRDKKGLADLLYAKDTFGRISAKYIV